MDRLVRVLLAVLIAVCAWNVFQAHTIGMEAQKTFTQVMALNKNILEQNKALADQNALLRDELKKRH